MIPINGVRFNMISGWKDFLLAQGAVLDDGCVSRFGELKPELNAVRGSTVIADLSHFALISATGEDVTAFLHGQFTNDVHKLDVGSVQWNGYCSPKGRLMATFLMWKQAGCYVMQLPATLRESVQKRLGMFVLRAKVKLAESSAESIRIGLAGPAAAALLDTACGVSAPTAGRLMEAEQATVLALGENRYQILALPQHAERIWERLAENTVKVGAGRWDWLSIRAGEALITPSTREEFVPQMVNFELIGGVNFQKGCYPGQEIVARTQYLGRLKRRMYLANINAESVAAGDQLYSPDLEGQSCGMVVNAAPSPDGGFDALAVIQIDSAQSQPVHFKTPTGPLLKLLALPYAVP